MLPHEFPPHQTVYDYFRQWSRDGRWQALNDQLRVGARKKRLRFFNSSALPPQKTITLRILPQKTSPGVGEECLKCSSI
jgi:transposase